MDAALSRHPTDMALRYFGLGKLPDSAAEAVNRHLEQCDDCRKRVAELSADSFLGRVRDAQQESSRSSTGSSPSTRTQSFNSQNASAPPPASTLPPGLADHPDYEVKKELGRGGMGVVYLVHNRLMDRAEVLKVMGPEIVGRPGVLDRFLREIRAVAKLRHPNIVAAYSAIRMGESIVFAMEHVDGLDLSRLVKLKGPMPVGHACLFIHQAALGLQHAYEEGLVHRDIKPGNLMVARKGNKATVKVLDFGLAKATREQQVDGGLTSVGQALGTPDYIAPEQILDAPNADIRADLYSLGATLYYLLAGRPPFRASSLYDIYQAHISRDADPLNFLRPEVPSELAALVAKLMAKEATRRFQKPSEVARALTPFYKKGSASLPSPKAELSQADSPWADSAIPNAGPAPIPPELASDSTPDPQIAEDMPRPESRWSSWINLGESEPTPLPRRVAAPPRRRGWLILLIGLLLGLPLLVWAAGIMRITTPEGVIELENLPPDAEVVVDGEKVSVSWPGGGKPAEITVPEGQHGVVVNKTKFQTFIEVVRIKEGEHATIRIKLVPVEIPPDESPVGRWVHLVGGNRGIEITFNPDGSVTQVNGMKGQWSLEGSKLTMHWPIPQSPGGFWIDKVQLLEDGNHYQGTNQGGVPIGGVRIRAPDGPGGAPPGPSGDTNHVFLSELKPKQISSWKDPNNQTFKSNGRLGMELDVPIEVQGKESPHGIFLHPPSNLGSYLNSYVKYDIYGEWDQFRGAVAINRHPFGHPYPGAPLVFQVIGDGKVLWSSQAVTKFDTPQSFEVGVTSVKELVIVVFSTGSANTAWAVWLEPELIKTQPVPPAAPIDRSADVNPWPSSVKPEGQMLPNNSGFLSVSPDGRFVALKGPNNSLMIVGATDPERPVKMAGHTAFNWGAAFSPDGRFLASTGNDNLVRVWDTTTGAEVHQLRGHQRGVIGVAYSRDGGRIAATGMDFTVRVWDAKTGESLKTLTGHTDFVWCVAFSPDGKRLASGSGNWIEEKSAPGSGELMLWDLESGTGKKLDGHPMRVNGVAFSPDGRHLASASFDGTAKVWDVETTACVATFAGHKAYLLGLQFSPDGRRIASIARERIVRVWDPLTGQAVADLEGLPIHPDFLHYSPGGRWLYAGSRFRLKAWETDPPAGGAGGSTNGATEKPTQTQVGKPSVPPAAILNRPGLTNTLGMRLLLISAGEFEMGSPDTDPDALVNEKPRHRVRLTRPFYLGATEVTQGQYRAVMNQNPSQDKGADDLPVDCVHWRYAVSFCNALSEKEHVSPYYQIEGDKVTAKVTVLGGDGYRLPTEAEWEYACRGGATTRYSFGDDPDALVEYAWFKDNSGGTTHPVGQKRPNGFGLFDMHGNVSEWCWDPYDDEYYKYSSLINPDRSLDGRVIKEWVMRRRGMNNTSIPSQGERAHRGGNRYDITPDCRSASRDAAQLYGGYGGLGFRVARFVSARTLEAATVGTGGSPTSASERPTQGLVGNPSVPPAVEGNEPRPTNSSGRREEVTRDIERLRETFRQDITAAVKKIEPLFQELEDRLKRSHTPDLEGRLDRLKAAKRLFVEKGHVPSYLGKASKTYVESAGDAMLRLTKGLDEAKRFFEAEGDDAGAKLIQEEAVTHFTRMKSIAAGLRFSPSGELVVMPTAEAGPGWTWLWTTNQPPQDWNQPQFQPVGWARGRAAFGKGAPNANYGTPWSTPQIWLRTTIDLPEIQPDDVVFLRHRHDDDLELYSDARPVITLPGFRNIYDTHFCSNEQKMVLNAGSGNLAATCKQSWGGQAFDVGLTILRSAARDPRLNPLSRAEEAWLSNRNRMDPGLRVRTDLALPKLHADNGNMKVVVDRWTELIIEGDKAYLDRALGRNKLICTHPLGRENPATLDFSDQTKNGRGILQLWVHSWPARGYDGSLRIKVAGQVLHQNTIKAADGWQRLEIPFDHQAVVVEHIPLEWNMEFLFFDYTIAQRK